MTLIPSSANYTRDDNTPYIPVALEAGQRAGGGAVLAPVRIIEM